ncbi:hypothetical protein CFN78_13650 [Amycolatopsis antarctica]|uniref:DUF2530 domain-containing protein n=1 Tax=Amycolatopsis antarctica TaxID=1854586 RepID=A0A263D2U0_9PSEU|nr:hypothetical protein [Amycolatopsis antarctica]OZM72671.1 hypothetical protein CFN78_13650 [Amycolatopsis antarctica]
MEGKRPVWVPDPNAMTPRQIRMLLVAAIGMTVGAVCFLAIGFTSRMDRPFSGVWLGAVTLSVLAGLNWSRYGSVRRSRRERESHPRDR